MKGEFVARNALFLQPAVFLYGFVNVKHMEHGTEPFWNRLGTCEKEERTFLELFLRKLRVFSRFYAGRKNEEISVPDNCVKNYLTAVTKAYVHKSRDEEFRYLVQVREVVEMLEDRMKIEENIGNLKELADEDEEMKKMGREEHLLYTEQLSALDSDLLSTISENLGRDSCRDVIFEITAGVGGQEAMIFVSDLFNMYQKYFDRLGYSQEVLDVSSESGIGGMRHISILVTGEGAFESLRHEGGVHRVQRIPATEKSGRIHTSTAAVAVLPQPSEIEVDIKERDLRIETKNASGAGGQHVNTTDSAVRITHIPTGIVVEAQTDRSQIRNRKIAMMKLRTRIYEEQLSEQKAETGSLRKKQRGMGRRNEKIRTYNYSQDRVTDHRINSGTLHNLRGFMEDGEGLEELQEKLQRQFQVKVLQETLEKWK